MSRMSECVGDEADGGGAPWLEREAGGGGAPTVTAATVIEGAEVVRTAAVSYATPILHQVFIQAPPSSSSSSSSSPSSSSSSSSREAPSSAVGGSPTELKSFRLSIAPGGVSTPSPAGFAQKTECGTKLVKESSSSVVVCANSSSTAVACQQDPSSSSSSFSSSTATTSSSVPLWLFSSSILPSNSVVLRPLTPTTIKYSSNNSSEVLSINSSSSSSPVGFSFFTSSSSSLSSSSSSSSSSPILSPFPATLAPKNDDELTSLSWLQDSNLLMGTALSPIKQHHLVQSSSPAPSKASDPPPPPPPSSSSSWLAGEGGERKVRPQRASNGVANAKESADAVAPPAAPSTTTAAAVPVTSSAADAREGDEEEFKADSPTSDYGEESTEPGGEGGLEPPLPNSNPSLLKAHPLPYNPQIHIKAKPPFSFSCLIFMAIEESPSKALPVKDIYSWILDHYPYYRNAPTGWKNSVRHNLSLNKCFSKVEKAPNLGKGSLWMVDPTFRPNLLQAMSKSSVAPPQSTVDRTCMVSNKAVINTKYLYGLTSKTPEKVITMGDFVVQNEVEVLPSAATLSSSAFPDPEPEGSPQAATESASPARESPPPTSISTIQLHAKNGTTKYYPSSEWSYNKEERERIGASPPEREGLAETKTKCLYTPNPDLFPRLAKRLQETHCAEVMQAAGRHPEHEHHFGSAKIDVQSEDVDAAAAMLVLKHGHKMLSPYHETFSNLRVSSNTTAQLIQDNLNKRNHLSSESSDSGSVLISSSSSLDHAYVSKGTRNNRNNNNNNSTNNYNYNRLSLSSSAGQGSTESSVGKANEAPPSISPTSSVDEAFFDDSFEVENGGSDVRAVCPSVECDPRFEEADALLNLASVATSLASQREMLLPSPYASCIESHSSSLPSETHHRKTQHTFRSNDINGNDSCRPHEISSDGTSGDHTDPPHQLPTTTPSSTTKSTTNKRKLNSGTATTISPAKKKGPDFARISPDSDSAGKLSPKLSEGGSDAPGNRNRNRGCADAVHNNNNHAVLNRNNTLSKLKKKYRNA